MNRRTPSRLSTAAMASVLALGVLPPPLAFAQKSQTAQQTRFRGEKVTLNFVNAEIDGVARAMSAILRRQFLVDPRVRGTITLYSEDPLTPNEAYINFLAALRGLGFTVVETGNISKIVPEADAKLQAGTVSVDSVPRRGDQVLTQIFRLNHENANNLVPVLRPLITPNNTINANPGNNTLVITDYADNLQRIAQIIAAMDVPSTGDVDVIPLRYAVAADIAPLIQRLIDAPTSGAVPGATAAGVGAPTILIDSRSNSLIVRSNNASKLASVRSIVARLDAPPVGSAATGNIWVVHLKNADATKLATVLRAAFSSGGSSSNGGTSPTSMPNAVNAAGTAGTSIANAATSGAAAPITPSAGPSTGGFIQADPATNSLIITAAEPLYRQVRQMIDQLDARRAQVYIESMIVEVSGSNEADFGFQWQGLIGAGSRNAVLAGSSYSTSAGSVGTNSINTLNNGTSASVAAAAANAVAGLSSGLNIGLVRNYGGIYGLAAIAQFLQSQANTNITSTPNLVTLDNEEAKIIVGSNVPFVTGQYTSTGTALTSPFQTIERKDVGITLRIKPQVGEDGTIRMAIFQESSSVIAQATGTANAGPTTNKRSIESNVVVDDGQILVLGGLIEDRYVDDTSKVPLLGDIPYLGALFRSQSRSKTRTNLMVFLRPTVMRDQASADRITAERYDQIRQFQKDMRPTPNILIPVGDSPVVPPLRRLEDGQTPISAPQTSPGTEKGVPPRPRPDPVEPQAPIVIVPAPVVVTPITPTPSPAAPASAPR